MAAAALVHAAARVLADPVARHADAAELQALGLLLPDLAGFAELGTVGVRSWPVGLHLAAGLADQLRLVEGGERLAVGRAPLLLLRNAGRLQRLRVLERRRLLRNDPLALLVGERGRNRVEHLRLAVRRDLQDFLVARLPVVLHELVHADHRGTVVQYLAHDVVRREVVEVVVHEPLDGDN